MRGQQNAADVGRTTDGTVHTRRVIKWIDNGPRALASIQTGTPGVSSRDCAGAPYALVGLRCRPPRWMPNNNENGRGARPSSTCAGTIHAPCTRQNVPQRTDQQRRRGQHDCNVGGLAASSAASSPFNRHAVKTMADDDGRSIHSSMLVSDATIRPDCY